MRTVVLIVVMLMATLGCERTEVTQSSASDQPTRRVDETGLRYLYYEPTGGMHSAKSLSDVPLYGRAAAVVYRRADGMPRLDADTYQVADLLDARPGRTFETKTMTRKRLIRRTHNAQNAQRRAEAVRFYAQEVAQLNPRSERSQQSRKALRMLKDLVEDDETSPPDDSGDSKR